MLKVCEDMQFIQSHCSVTVREFFELEFLFFLLVFLYLRCFCLEQPKSWAEFIPLAQYWYNTRFQRAAHCTPFEKTSTFSLAKFAPEETLVEVVAQDFMDHGETLKQLKFHLERAQNQMTRYVYANMHGKIALIKARELYIWRLGLMAGLPWLLNSIPN